MQDTKRYAAAMRMRYGPPPELVTPSCRCTKDYTCRTCREYARIAAEAERLRGAQR